MVRSPMPDQREVRKLVRSEFARMMGELTDGQILKVDHTEGEKNYVSIPTPSSTELPVGSIFPSYVTTNPNVLLGYGVWVELPAGRMLVSRDAGDTDLDLIGDLYGVKNVTPTGTNAASSVTGATAASGGAHTHATSGTAASGGAHTHTTSGTAASGGSHTHTVDAHSSAFDAFLDGFDEPTIGTTHNVSTDGSHTHSVTGSAASGGAHTHSVTGSAASSGAHTHSVSGGTAAAQGFTGDSQNNMPPVVVVYIWRRTA